MSDKHEDSLNSVNDEGDGFYGVKARPQRSRMTKKAEKSSRSKKIKRSSPIGGLHQRRNKRISW